METDRKREETAQVYIHLGNDVSVRTEDLIGIFDIDTTTTSKDTRALLKKYEDEDNVTNVSADLPKSFILCRYDGETHLFVSAISSATLRKRVEMFGFADGKL